MKKLIALMALLGVMASLSVTVALAAGDKVRGDEEVANGDTVQTCNTNYINEDGEAVCPYGEYNPDF